MTLENVSYGTVSARRVGSQVILQLWGIGLSKMLSQWGSRKIGRISKEYAPAAASSAALATDSTVSILVVYESGEIYVNSKNSTIEKGHNIEGQVAYFLS